MMSAKIQCETLTRGLGDDKAAVRKPFPAPSKRYCEWTGVAAPAA